MKPVKKAVFPVAGLGTRFLPATKASPKEMLPIVDKPLIQYAAEEAIAAGVELLIFITGRGKRAIADHFDVSYELEAELEQKHKTALLEEIRGIMPRGIKAAYIRQPKALGLGHAVLMAQPLVGDEPFAVILADDLIDNDAQPAIGQLVDVYHEHGGSAIGVQVVPKDEVHKYGIVNTQEVNERVGRIEAIVEKPPVEEAKSDLAVVGRYVLSPRIFEHLRTVKFGTGDELQLTDAIASLLTEEAVYACRFEGKRYDCGSKLGYLEATVEYGLKHPVLGKDFAAFLKQLKV